MQISGDGEPLTCLKVHARMLAIEHCFDPGLGKGVNKSLNDLLRSHVVDPDSGK